MLGDRPLRRAPPLPAERRRGTPACVVHEHGRQVEPLVREPILETSAVRPIVALGRDARRLQSQQPLREHVAGNALSAIEKLFVGPLSLEHQVSHDQQKPGIAKEIERDADGTVGETGFTVVQFAIVSPLIALSLRDAP